MAGNDNNTRHSRVSPKGRVKGNLCPQSVASTHLTWAVHGEAADGEQHFGQIATRAAWPASRAAGALPRSPIGSRVYDAGRRAQPVQLIGNRPLAKRRNTGNFSHPSWRYSPEAPCYEARSQDLVRSGTFRCGWCARSAQP